MERAAEWEEFIQARAEQLPGYERTLEQTVESIRLCAAIKQAKGEELLAAFKAHSSS